MVLRENGGYVHDRSHFVGSFSYSGIEWLLLVYVALQLACAVVDYLIPILAYDTCSRGSRSEH